jgi:hypothetical protein
MRRRLLASALVAVFVVACSDSNDSDADAPAGDEKIADRGDVQTAWTESEDQELAPLVYEIANSGLVETVADGLNQSLRLPKDLLLAHTDCGEANAFYSPSDESVFMCYELMRQVLATVYDPSLTDEENATALIGTWLFVMFHELGHALIDYYDLPITGKEEDAVDDFSTVLLIEADLSEMAVQAASFWAQLDDGMYSQLHYADEHSLNPQRFYTILCTVYGSDPETYAGLVEYGYLPEARAERCPGEYAQKSSAWNRLLEPFAK